MKLLIEKEKGITYCIRHVPFMLSSLQILNFVEVSFPNFLFIFFVSEFLYYCVDNFIEYSGYNLIKCKTQKF